VQEIERFRADALYVEQHRAELLKRFLEHWVAVYNQDVVASAKSPADLVTELERRGIPPGDVVHEYLTQQDDLLIL
jgi:hypothetical protein